MLNELTHDQKMLAACMSELSEQAFHAGWMENLEHALWRAVTEGPFRYGHLDITSVHIEKLNSLSQACQGWIVFDRDSEETFISLRDWMTLYDVMLAS